MRTFNVVIERDPETDLLVGHVPGWSGVPGFIEVRQRGSHKQFRHPDGRGTTVPFHIGRDISPTLLRKIAKDVGLTAQQLCMGGTQY